MVRCSVTVCDAAPEDATALVAVWVTATDRAASVQDPAAHAAQEAAAAIARIAADPDQRLLVARVDDEVAGAVHLLRAPVSPVHSDTAVYVMHLQVIEALRRHGVGRALMEATVGWAEEKDTEHVIAAASVASRDANRFMARLGLGQVAVVRGATVPALRAKLPVEPPAAARVDGRHHRIVGAVIAQRRSLRRSQTRPS
jgi:GNAT superfamily N-acetyltransferase